MEKVNELVLCDIYHVLLLNCCFNGVGVDNFASLFLIFVS